MKLKLLRNRFTEDYTTGQLYVNDEFFCFTLEDKVREQDGVPVDKWKVDSVTAIPRGIYKVVLQDSPRFGPDTITLLKVPGFTHIRIHAGNTHRDTEGCIIVGWKITKEGVIVPGTTRTCLFNLKNTIKGHDNITIQII